MLTEAEHEELKNGSESFSSQHPEAVLSWYPLGQKNIKLQSLWTST